MKYVLLLGRILFSLQFILTSVGHWTTKTFDWASSHGIPLPKFFIPLWWIIALLGGLSILLGYKARLGAWLVVIFLIPVTIITTHYLATNSSVPSMVPYWEVMKNLSAIGAALMIAYLGSGALSLDKKSGKKI